MRTMAHELEVNRLSTYPFFDIDGGAVAIFGAQYKPRLCRDALFEPGGEVPYAHYFVRRRTHECAVQRDRLLLPALGH
jgi:hypothetical protein